MPSHVVALVVLALACSAATAQQNDEVVCEKTAFTLQCPEPQAIEIVGAQYGRTSAEPDCGRAPESLTDTDCRSRNALVDLKRLCNGMQTCELPEDLNEFFGDPCSNTVKYANISWDCISVDMLPIDPTSGNFKKSACEKTPLVVICPENQLIDVVFSNYGRLPNTETCGQNEASLGRTSCSSPAAIDYIAGLCQGQNSCSIDEITSDALGTVDPCPGTFKVAEVEYTCMDADASEKDDDDTRSIGSLTQVCENQVANISCPAGTFVDLTSATYGRNSQSPSCGKSGPSIADTECGAKDNVLEFMEGFCDGSTACSVVVGTSFFPGGDPCSGIRKYLDFQYDCTEEMVSQPSSLPAPISSTSAAPVEPSTGAVVDSSAGPITSSSAAPVEPSTGAAVDSSAGPITSSSEGPSTSSASEAPEASNSGASDAVAENMIGQPSSLPTPIASMAASPVDIQTEATVEEGAAISTNEGQPISPASEGSLEETNSDADDDNDDEADVCFPAESTVELADGSVRSMEDLSINDAVRTGDGTYHPVFFFSHRAPKASAQFVEVWAAGKSVRLSPSHYIATPKGLVSAAALRVGQEITHQVLGLVKVEKVKRVLATGLYAPHTSGNNGALFVDGFKVSEFTTAVHPTVANGLLSPLKWLHRMTGLSVSGILSTNGHSLSKLLPSGPSEVN